MRLNLYVWLMFCFIFPGISVIAQQRELKEGYYADGKLRYKGYFVGKEPVGEMTQYYPSGQVKARLVYNGKETIAVIYSKDGEFTSAGKYLDRKKTGVWEYKKGERLLTREEYAEDKLNGTSVKYYASGEAAEIKTWQNGVLSGAWKVFYDNGKLKFETFFVEGQLNGSLEAYSYEGKIKVKGEYRNNVKEGLWYYYDEEGKNARKRKYNGGISDRQQEDDLKENEKIQQLEDQVTKIIDPANFVEEPEVYLQISDN